MGGSRTRPESTSLRPPCRKLARPTRGDIAGVDCSLFGLAQWCASGAVLAAAARGDVQLAASPAPPARPAPFGHLAIDPGGNTVEGASTINWSAAGLTIANGVTLTLNATRQLTVICNGGGSTHFIIDIAGYYL